ncbi:hypothetical protein GCM10017786_72190 [Amycolatopsis deserti]|uniref:Transposase n=1 Tax=Amycolatopsis deserti TaxID=185696 RepID=A0ABQ3JEV1_9PSEU|nr:hypothetical protein GCM10017786_72190 [Amycolatopsis deserti]
MVVEKFGRPREDGSDQHKAARRAPRVGYEYVHCAIDDHSRLAYAEIHPDEKPPSPAPASSAATTITEPTPHSTTNHHHPRRQPHWARHLEVWPPRP